MLQIFEHAFGNAVLCHGKEKRAFHELATIKAGANYVAPTIKLLGLVALAPFDALLQPHQGSFLGL